MNWKKKKLPSSNNIKDQMLFDDIEIGIGNFNNPHDVNGGTLHDDESNSMQLHLFFIRSIIGIVRRVRTKWNLKRNETKRNDE